LISSKKKKKKKKKIKYYAFMVYMACEAVLIIAFKTLSSYKEVNVQSVTDRLLSQ